jgi:predicted membrane protein
MFLLLFCNLMPIEFVPLALFLTVIFFIIILFVFDKVITGVDEELCMITDEDLHLQK